MALTPSRHGSAGIRGITPEQRAQRQAAFERLSAAIAPHLRTAFDAKLKALKEQCTADDPEVIALKDSVAELCRAEGKSEDEIAAEIAEIESARQRLVDPARPAGEEEESEFKHACDVTIGTWLHALVESVPRSDDGSVWIDGAALDDAMMPPAMPDEVRQVCLDSMVNTVVDFEDALAALRALRAALPECRRLPDDAVACLILGPSRISVINV